MLRSRRTCVPRIGMACAVTTLGVLTVAAGQAPRPGAQGSQDLAAVSGRIHAEASGDATSGVTYAAAQRGLFVTRDGGQSWTELALPSASREVLVVAVDPADPSCVLAGTRNGLWKSEDSGRAWTRLDGLPQDLVPVSLQLRDGEGLMYLGTSRQGLFRSRDGGITWERVGAGMPLSLTGAPGFASLPTLALAPEDDSRILVGTELGDVLLSIDDGATWNRPQGLPETATRRTDAPVIAFDRSVPQTVFAILSRPVHSERVANALYKSVDGGVTWFLAEQLKDNERYYAIRVDSGNPRVLTLLGDGSTVVIDDTFDGEARESSEENLIKLQRGAALGATTNDVDIGSIAVLIDDGSLLDRFDVDQQTMEFTPNGNGGYDVAFTTLMFDTVLGTDLVLTDDSSSSQGLGFSFPFYGTSHTSVFVNANGNVTFGAGDSDYSESFTEFITGLEVKIAPLWDDLNPAAGGGVFFKTDGSSQATITWNGVAEYGTKNSNTFQIALLSSGVIRFSYNGVALGDALVGVSNCCQTSTFSSVFMDYSADLPLSGSAAVPILERFFGELNTTAVSQRFYSSHSDNFDMLVVFGATSLPGNLAGSGATAFHQGVRNDVSGIGRTSFNNTAAFGSAGQLQSFLNMNSLVIYPADPTANLPGNNDTTLTLLGQEAGHRWGAFVQFDESGVCSDDLLGRSLAHWCFYYDSDGSVLEGNSWVDNGGGSFTTDEDTVRFSDVDQYLMGVRAGAQVPNFFFIDNPTGWGSCSSTPSTGVTVSGTRQEVTLAQIQTCEGARSPAFGTAPTSFTQAFILIVPQGETATSADLTKLDGIRTAWESYFATATDGNATINTKLSIFTFTDDPLVTGATLVKALHFQEMRSRVDALRAARGLGAFTYTDATLAAGVTPVAAVHVNQLRTALDLVYSADGVALPAYTNIIAAGSTIKAVDITELRAAIEDRE